MQARALVLAALVASSPAAAGPRPPSGAHAAAPPAASKPVIVTPTSRPAKKAKSAKPAETAKPARKPKQDKPAEEGEDGEAAGEAEDQVAASEEEAAPAPAAAKAEQKPAAVADELAALRRFEEGAFPRHAGEARPPPPAAEGAAPRERAPRASTEHPREGPHSDERAVAGASQRSTPPPERWLARLALPDLPVRWDAKLVRYLQFYKSNPVGRAIMSAWLRRMGRHQGLIAGALARRQLPRALVHVAMIESGFNPKVTSRAGAAGIWQFMAGPGRSYGLQRDHWVDERRDPEKSAEAAARYLKDLHQRFGSWDLALASYNAGHGAVTRAIQKYNTNDYWRLCGYEAGLPWETALYVPKILAAAIVALNRAAFGFDSVKPDPELAWALVAAPTSVTLAQAAHAAGVGRELLEQLNPELRRSRTPPIGKVWLRVPKGSEERFYPGIAAVKGELARYKPYLVRLGEGVKEIARDHGMTPAALRALNGLERAEELRPGVTILVPARAAPRRVPVARDAAKPAEEEDETILVAVPADRPTAVAGRRRVFYRVVPGDSLEETAAHLGVGRAELAGWNALDEGARLIAGMVLQAFVEKLPAATRVVLLDPARVKTMAAGSEGFLTEWEERRGRRRLSYRVRDGDTLASVAKRFGLSLGSLLRINRLDRRATLRAGQSLIVYVELARLRKNSVFPQRRLRREDQSSPAPPRTAARSAAPSSRPAARAASE